MIKLLDRDVEEHSFRCVHVDPPWAFRSFAPSKNPESSRNVERHYRTMTLDEIAALPIQHVTDYRAAHLFLWATGPFLPAAIDLMASWKFRYSAIAFCWVKLERSFDVKQMRFIPADDADFHVSLGFTTRHNVELCLLGRRGSPKRLRKDVRELIIAPVREHSRKPDEAYARIERYCDGPRLDVFSRRDRPGWTSVGDEVGKFREAAE